MSPIHTWAKVVLFIFLRGLLSHISTMIWLYKDGLLPRHAAICAQEASLQIQLHRAHTVGVKAGRAKLEQVVEYDYNSTDG
jgi:hypothetical protein